ncbi:MAG: hypothetical protein ACTHNU_00975 [Gaiellales bacterium]
MLSHTVTDPGRSTRMFIRHYVEMVAAMFLGMFLLGAPVGWLLGALGVGTLSAGMMSLSMALEMALPMAAWMHYRGHSPRLNLEMVGAMLLPTAVLMPLISTGAISGMAAMGLEHTGMLAAMLAAMLFRLDAYAGAGHGGGHHAVSLERSRAAASTRA